MLNRKIAAELASLLNKCTQLRLKANAMIQDADDMARRIKDEKQRQQIGDPQEEKREERRAGVN